jgi:hypothetical protein
MGYVILLLLLAIGPLALVFGADSRLDDVARRRHHGRSFR